MVEVTFEGHSRSPRMMLFDSAYTTSY